MFFAQIKAWAKSKKQFLIHFSKFLSHEHPQYNESSIFFLPICCYFSFIHQPLCLILIRNLLPKPIYWKSIPICLANSYWPLQSVFQTYFPPFDSLRCEYFTPNQLALFDIYDLIPAINIDNSQWPMLQSKLFRNLLTKRSLTSQPQFYLNSFYKRTSDDASETRRNSFRSKQQPQSFQEMKYRRKSDENNHKQEQRDNKRPSQLWIENLSEEMKQFRNSHLQKIKAVNDINQHFLGTRLNTRYKVYNNQAQFSAIGKGDQFYRIDDLPFSYQQSQDKLELVSARVDCKRERFLLEKVSQQKLKTKMYEMAKGYFNDILQGERTTLMEPNFQRFAHSVIRSLQKSSYEFEVIKDKDNKKPVFIKDIYFMKGVTVNRNDNYSVDSYKVDRDSFEDEKLIEYTLWKNESERYPEREWEAMKHIVVRFQTIIEMPFVVDVSHPNRALPNIGQNQHEFVFEMAMVLPPKFAEFRLNEDDYTKSYRVNLSQLMITNVHDKNPFYSMSFKENEKERTLINKLI